MNAVERALARLNSAEAERDAACQAVWAIVKVDYPAVADAFFDLCLHDGWAARWLCGPLGTTGQTGAELIAAGCVDEVIQRLGQIAVGAG